MRTSSRLSSFEHLLQSSAIYSYVNSNASLVFGAEPGSDMLAALLLLALAAVGFAAEIDMGQLRIQQKASQRIMRTEAYLWEHFSGRLRDLLLPKGGLYTGDRWRVLYASVAADGMLAQRAQLHEIITEALNAGPRARRNAAVEGIAAAEKASSEVLFYMHHLIDCSFDPAFADYLANFFDPQAMVQAQKQAEKQKRAERTMQKAYFELFRKIIRDGGIRCQ